MSYENERRGAEAATDAEIRRRPVSSFFAQPSEARVTVAPVGTPAPVSGVFFRDTDPRPVERSAADVAALEAVVTGRAFSAELDAIVRRASKRVAQAEDERLIESLARRIAVVYFLPEDEVRETIRQWAHGKP